MAQDTKTKSRRLMLEEKEAASDSMRRHRVQIGNQHHELKVFSVINNVPLYRVENNRIASEIDALKQDPHKSEILSDPYDPAAQELIETELKKLVSKANLDRLIKNSGVQEEPLLLTRDGVVVNGNRRLVLLRKHNIGDGYVDVCLLPKGTTDADISLIEFRLQMDDPGKADYSWVNQLIAIRRAIDSDIDPEKIRSSMPSLSTAQFNKLRDSLNVIDEFLVRRGTPDNYADIGDNKYFFEELQRVMKKYKRFPEKREALLWAAVNYYDSPPNDTSEDRSYLKFKKATRQIDRIQKHFASPDVESSKADDPDDPLGGVGSPQSIFTTLPTNPKTADEIHTVVLSGEDADARSKNAAQLHTDLEQMARKLLNAEPGSRTANLTGILRQIDLIQKETERLRNSVLEIKKKSG